MGEYNIKQHAHSVHALSLAQKESAEHLLVMQSEGIPAVMKTKPLRISAFALDDPMAPYLSMNNQQNKSVSVVKIVHFIRHGQAFHNFLADMYIERGLKWNQFDVNSDNPYTKPELLDAPLTEKGRAQASLLHHHYVASLSSPPELVVSSPLCRALSTCSIAFQSVLPKCSTASNNTNNNNNDTQWLCHELVREEHGAHICDRRRCASEQMRDFPMFDFSLLETEEDVLFNENRRETKMEVAERAYKFLEWMALRQESHIGLVSHSGWLMTVFNGILECDDSLKNWFQNGEMRSAVLVFERNK